MIKMTSIEITRGEGPTKNTPVPVGKTFTFNTWAKANSHLRDIAYDMQSRGQNIGYDKTDFKVIFEDGETYEGRADVKADMDDTNLTRHIQEFLNFMAGDFCPSHMKQETYQDMVAMYEKDGTAAGCREWLNTYKFTD